MDTSIFKAYDIRGIYPEQINAEIVFKIAQAYVKLLQNPPACIASQSVAGRPSPSHSTGSGQALEKRGELCVAVGRDMRLSGKEFSEAVISSLTKAGVNVVDLGVVSTDQLYFASATLEVDGGIQITASHNPKEYGGMKMVRAKGHPISGDTGIYEIRDMVANGNWEVVSETVGTVTQKNILPEYFKYVLSFFNTAEFKKLKVVANTNFGMGNLNVDFAKENLPVEFLKIVYQGLDGNFPLPSGRPDPLRVENRQATIDAILELKPDLGVAWDADADRCFFFDENGKFVTPAYINALLSEYYLKKQPNGKIIHDTRVVRVIDYLVEKNGGVSISTKAGHSFIKERMIAEDALFGSETSGHYYFKDNFYLDNGLFPFLIVLEILSKSGKTFSQVLKPLREQFFISEEINFKVSDPSKVIAYLKNKYQDATIDETDGQSYNYANWRFNVRLSNTESLLRVNLEADTQTLLEEKTKEVSLEIENLK
jgi:phosphomannomutase